MTGKGTTILLGQQWGEVAGIGGAIEPKYEFGEVERFLGSPDLIVLTGWQDLCRVANRYPSDRHERVLRHNSSEMHDCIDPYFRTGFYGGAIEDPRSRRKKHILLDIAT
jgi:hypothetical protein